MCSLSVSLSRPLLLFPYFPQYFIVYFLIFIIGLYEGSTISSSSAYILSSSYTFFFCYYNYFFFYCSSCCRVLIRRTSYDYFTGFCFFLRGFSTFVNCSLLLTMYILMYFLIFYAIVISLIPISP